LGEIRKRENKKKVWERKRKTTGKGAESKNYGYGIVLSNNVGSAKDCRWCWRALD